MKKQFIVIIILLQIFNIFLPKVVFASVELSKSSAIVEMAKKYAWPLGTSSAIYTNKSTKAFKKAAKKYGYKSSVSQTDCGAFVNVCVRSSNVDKKFRALAGVNDHFPSYNKEIFSSVKSIVITKGKVDKKKLLAGDIIRYKTDNGQHVFIYMGDSVFAEASRGKKYPRLRKIGSNGLKCNKNKRNINTVQIIRAKDLVDKH